MKKQLVTLGIMGFLAAQAPAYALVPITVQWRIKQAVLLIPRTVKFFVLDDCGLRQSIYCGWNSDRINSQCGNQFEFWSLR